MDLDDRVMINGAALWPLLKPQWKDPEKWWKQLCLDEKELQRRARKAAKQDAAEAEDYSNTLPVYSDFRTVAQNALTNLENPECFETSSSTAAFVSRRRYALATFSQAICK
jgi:hypothetical protein